MLESRPQNRTLHGSLIVSTSFRLVSARSSASSLKNKSAFMPQIFTEPRRRISLCADGWGTTASKGTWSFRGLATGDRGDKTANRQVTPNVVCPVKQFSALAFLFLSLNENCQQFYAKISQFRFSLINLSRIFLSQELKLWLRVPDPQKLPQPRTIGVILHGGETLRLHWFATLNEG